MKSCEMSPSVVMTGTGNFPFPAPLACCVSFTRKSESNTRFRVEGKCLYDGRCLVAALGLEEAQSDKLSGFIGPFLPFSDTWVNIPKGSSDAVEITRKTQLFIDEKVSDARYVVLLFNSCHVKVHKTAINLPMIRV